MTEAAPETLPPATFPSLEWFQNLAAVWNANRVQAEHLGYIDCVARFTIGEFAAQVTFEEFEVMNVETGSEENADAADFNLVGETPDWQEMIENIAAGDGQPDLEHTLNRLSHMGTPFNLIQDDPLRRDYYFRYSQSLQAFFNLSAKFESRFG